MAGESFRLHLVRSEPGEFDEPEVAPLSGFAGAEPDDGARAELAELGDRAAPSEAAVADLRTAGESTAAATSVSAAELASAGGDAPAERTGRSATVADFGRKIGTGVARTAGERRSGRRAARRPETGEPTGAERRAARDARARADAVRPSRSAPGRAPDHEPEPVVEPEHEPASPSARRQARVDRAAEKAQAAIDADPAGVAREICLRLLTERARTRHELAQALQRRGIPDEAAATVLSRFDEVGLIDDAAFAGQWVRSRHRSRGLAKRAIAMELRRKGVDDEIAGEALAEVDVEAEEERAYQLVVKKLRTMAVGTPEEQATAARRLVGMLARKGYGAGVAYGVVRRALAEHGAELDESDHSDE